MRTATVLALLLMLPLAAQAGTASSGPGQARLIMVADSAHTLFHADSGGGFGAGRMVELPQGGMGVTTGGSSHYQTFVSPGGGGVAVPDGNAFSSVIGSGGRAGTALTPN